MKFNHKRAVSPIIASLLLIAIAVAAGIIVYVYVNSLAGGLTGSGGGNQVAQETELAAYDFTGRGSAQTVGNAFVVVVKDAGSSSVSISGVYFDGTPLTQYTLSSGYYGNCTNLLTSCTVSTIVANQWFSVPATNAVSFNAGYTTITLLDSAPNDGLSTTTLTATTNAQVVFTIAGSGAAAGTGAGAGTSHTIKIVTSTGGVSVFTVVAGRSG